MNTMSQKESEILQILVNHFKDHYSCQKHALQKMGSHNFEFDLACKNKKDERIFVEIKTVEKVNDYNIRDFVFAKNRFNLQNPNVKSAFYLSIESAASLTPSAKQLLDATGIGVIRIKGNKVESVVEPESLQNKIQKVVNDSLSFSKECLDGRAFENAEYSALVKKIDNQIKEITDTIVPSKIKPYKLRISAEIVDKLEYLNRLSYASLLIDFGRQYKNIDSASDENRLILSTLGKLWEGKYGKVQGAKAFTSFEKFEPILKDTPRYRDHMVHPFQVFLMGSLIIDANYDYFVRTYRKSLNDARDDSLEFAWLLCATFHDICYPIQKYEQFSKNFFLDFLQSESSPITFQAEKLLLENDNLKYIDQLVALFEHYSSKGTRWKFDSPCKIDHSLRASMITELSNKNHALLSALALIKKTLAEEFVKANLEEYKEGRFSTDIYPAALAIALHDEKMLDRLKTKISIDEMPLCFLLIYCDLVQENGRSDGEEIVELHYFACDGNSIDSTLSFTQEENFAYKTQEMEKIYKKLLCSSIHYKLNLRYSGSTRSEDTFKEITHK